MELEKTIKSPLDTVKKIAKITHEILRIAALLGVLILWIVEFPVCKMQAKAKYREFSATYQNVTSDDILEIKYHKDYKMGGYYVNVKYKELPDYDYSYVYLDGKMTCHITKDGVYVLSDKALEIPGVDGWH